MTDTQTQTHTDTHTHTHGHTRTHTDTRTPNFFIALSCSGTSITSRKVLKSGGRIFLFFA
jgi:hypothetical protein